MLTLPSAYMGVLFILLSGLVKEAKAKMYLERMHTLGVFLFLTSLPSVQAKRITCESGSCTGLSPRRSRTARERIDREILT